MKKHRPLTFCFWAAGILSKWYCRALSSSLYRVIKQKEKRKRRRLTARNQLLVCGIFLTMASASSSFPSAMAILSFCCKSICSLWGSRGPVIYSIWAIFHSGICSHRIKQQSNLFFHLKLVLQFIWSPHVGLQFSQVSCLASNSLQGWRMFLRAMKLVKPP